MCKTKEVVDRLVNESFVVKDLSFGHYQITAPELFTFKPNPEISDVHPRSSIVE